MIMVPGASSFGEVMEVTREVYFAAGDIMAKRGKAAGLPMKEAVAPVRQQ